MLWIEYFGSRYCWRETAYPGLVYRLQFTVYSLLLDDHKAKDPKKILGQGERQWSRLQHL